MKIAHWAKKEASGLFRQTLEIVKYEERQGHQVCLKEPQGNIIYGTNGKADIECVHSQLDPDCYHNDVPKFMWMHGEPLSSVGNGVSMKAIVDLATRMDAFICMRREEQIIWNSIKRTYYVPKGIDLEQYHNLDGVTEKLSGEPAVLYIENWRGSRNPLYLCVAMQEVVKKYPKARLHLYNCQDKRMRETFEALIKSNKWWTFIRTLSGPVQDVNLLYNRVDMVVSCLAPLFARGIEAFGAGRAFIGPGYREHDYPYTCELDPTSMANAIIKCWEDWGNFDFRKYAEEHHCVDKMVKKTVEIYQKHLEAAKL